MPDRCFIGVDVGTGSARAGVFDPAGALLGTAKHAIATWHEAGEIVEQSSDDIWQAVAAAVRGASRKAALHPAPLPGSGSPPPARWSWSTSGRPLPVGPSEDPARNIIVWMDHRALDQARRINLTREKVLQYVGGVISPEMETPSSYGSRSTGPQRQPDSSSICPIIELAGHRIARSLGLHRDLQMDLPRP